MDIKQLISERKEALVKKTAPNRQNKTLPGAYVEPEANLQKLSTGESGLEEEQKPRRKKNAKKLRKFQLKPKTRSWRADTLIVQAGGLTYSNMLKKIKLGKEAREVSNNIDIVSKTKERHLRVV